jgi:hypothetical protein
MSEDWKLVLCLAVIVAAVILVARFPVLLVGLATARCNDGSLSFSGRRRGTCSWRSGVAEWYRGVPA